MANDEAEIKQFLKDQKTHKKTENVSDITCGFWLFKGPKLQSLATENVYVVLYGIAGCCIAIAFSYFNGTITTLEKRYKIPTKITGLISVGNDIATVLTSAFLPYYAGRGHRPRWVGFGLLTLALFCILMALPHFLYGAGDEALKMTHGHEDAMGLILNTTNQLDKTLCHSNATSCVKDMGVSAPVYMLFLAQFISGIGCSLFYALGLSYMDDNSLKSRTPALLSMSAFLRMLGPAIGYSLASICLRLYIDPTRQPLIDNTDPRWLGAWWLGWIVLTLIMLIAALSIYMFPKELPSSRARRLRANPNDLATTVDPSLRDMLKTLKRLGSNKVYVYNTIASMLYFFGYIPYWIFTPKYIETQYRQSAAMASMATGTVALGFSAAGVLISGWVLSKYKPSARAMAAWNGIVDLLTIAGILCYVAIGCDESDRVNTLSTLTMGDSCSASCHCDYVHYAPICSPDNVTYISACHAGCTGKEKNDFGGIVYTGCKCLSSLNHTNEIESQYALDGACPVDCFKQFLIFLAVMCFLKFVGASGRSSNVLLALRCVPPEDKTFALGFGNMIVSVVSFIPSPILFGWILDNYCLVWGKTCSNKGNCWLYDTRSLRYTMNLLSAFLIFLGSFWNIGVWYYAKDLKIFDDDEEEKKKNPKEEQIELKTKEEDLTKK